MPHFFQKEKRRITFSFNYVSPAKYNCIIAVRQKFNVRKLSSNQITTAVPLVATMSMELLSPRVS